MILEKIKKIKEEKGFTLLFSVLVSTLVLAVGASIISIALKQVQLSGTARESQYAFYAANTAMECAQYWDLKGFVFEGVNPTFVFPFDGETLRTSLDGINCAGGNIYTGVGFPDDGLNPEFTIDNGEPGSAIDWDLDNNTYTFRMAISNDIFPDVLTCAEVTVTKEVDDQGDADASNDQFLTTITSRGLNTCDPENNTRAVERGLILQYLN